VESAGRQSEMDAEPDEEVRSHLSMAQRDRVDRGESESDASINARREFGNVLLVKETTRDMRGWTTVENAVHREPGVQPAQLSSWQHLASRERDTSLRLEAFRL
jgi:hypothetical protein